jgi:hypothetical protein
MGGNKANYVTMNKKAKRNRYDGKHTAQLNRIYIRDKGICMLCGKHCPRSEASRDHIKDFAKCTPAEARSDDNVQLAHVLCNNIKHQLPKSKRKRKRRKKKFTPPPLTFTIESTVKNTE